MNVNFMVYSNAKLSEILHRIDATIPSDVPDPQDFSKLDLELRADITNCIVDSVVETL